MDNTTVRDQMSSMLMRLVEPMQLPVAPGRVCEGPKVHTPKPLTVEQHHVFPIYLQAKVWPDANRGKPHVTLTVWLCGTCHNNVHYFIDSYIAKKITPRMGRLLENIALRGLQMYEQAQRDNP